MQTIEATKKAISEGAYDSRFREVYACCNGETEQYRARYEGVIRGYEETFGRTGSDSIELFTAAGRTEIGGNHTDHQHGHVLAGSVSLSVIAAATPNDSGIIRIRSEGYPADTIDLSDLAVDPKEFGKSSAIIRGIAARLMDLGYKLRGMDAYTTSNVLKGSGLSSSAAFEIIIGVMLNCFFCEEKLSPIELAKIGQYAENVYFGKPSGLMDQMACSVGGVVAIDFGDAKKPDATAISLNLRAYGYALCIIDSGADHADLTDEYAAIPLEMKRVAGYFGKEFLREVKSADFYACLAEVRAKAGDRAALRAIHFFEEEVRTEQAVSALKAGDFAKFLRLVTASGHSSFEYLQNVFAASKPQAQAVSIALATCARLLNGEGGYRVHGGGFAGTIQAYVPQGRVQEFKKDIEAVLGEGSCHVLAITPVGGAKI